MTTVPAGSAQITVANSICVVIAAPAAGLGVVKKLIVPGPVPAPMASLIAWLRALRKAGEKLVAVIKLLQDEKKGGKKRSVTLPVTLGVL